MFMEKVINQPKLESSQVSEGLRMTPPTHPGWQLDSDVKDKDKEWFYMFSEKVINFDLLILNNIFRCFESF